MTPGGKSIAAAGAGLSFRKPLRPLAVFNTIVWQLFIPDQPVRPEVGHFDGQLISFALHYIGNIHAPGRSPYHSQVLPIEPDSCHVLHFPEVEKETVKPCPDREIEI